MVSLTYWQNTNGSLIVSKGKGGKRMSEIGLHALSAVYLHREGRVASARLHSWHAMIILQVTLAIALTDQVAFRLREGRYQRLW